MFLTTTLVLSVSLASLSFAAETDAELLIKKAAATRPVRYAAAIKSGVRLLPTTDARTFLLWWYPAGVPKAERRPIVTLHGHASWVFDEFRLWKKYAEERRFGILAPQWWFGKDESTKGYMTPQEIYAQVRKRFAREGITRGRAILHGFSRGSTNVYSIAAMDVHSGNRFFGLIIANAGSAIPDYPPTREIDEGEYGDKPFADTRWVLYCGKLDENPDRDGCPGMERTSRWIEEKGGTIALFIKDPKGGHGGFHQNPANIRRALEAYTPPQT